MTTRSVSRITQRPIQFLDVNETPGFALVFDYSGLMKTGGSSTSVVMNILSVVTICGGVFSV